MIIPLKEMVVNRTRLLLTILAMAWGTFSIAFMLSVGEGLRITFGTAINNNTYEAFDITGGKSTLPFRGQSNQVKVVLEKEDLNRLQDALKERALVTASADWRVILRRNKNTRSGPPITAVEQDFDSVHKVNVAPNGRFISAQDIKLHRQVVVLGTRSAASLFKNNEPAIGKTVYINERPFMVIGIQKKSLAFQASSRMPDEFTNWVPYTTYTDITNQRTYQDILISPKDDVQSDNVLNITKHVIAATRQLDPNDPGLLNIMDTRDMKQKTNLFLFGIEGILGIIGGLTLIVAGVGIGNVMYISVTRATREIGIRMAVGAKPYQILFYYLTESILTTAIGGFIGLLLTKLLIILIGFIPIQSKFLQYLGNPKPVLSMNVIMIVIGTLGTIGIFAGFFPAKRAAMINPAEALRYE